MALWQLSARRGQDGCCTGKLIRMAQRMGLIRAEALNGKMLMPFWGLRGLAPHERKLFDKRSVPTGWQIAIVSFPAF